MSTTLSNDKVNEVLLRLRYIIYLLAEDDNANNNLVSRKRTAELGYALIDGKIGLVGTDPKNFKELSAEEKIDLSTRPYQSPAELKTVEMLSKFEGKDATLNPHIDPAQIDPSLAPVAAAGHYPKLLSDPSSSRPDRNVHNSTEEAAARADGFTEVVPAPLAPEPPKPPKPPKPAPVTPLP